MCGDERKDEGVVERLTRELSEARKEALIANRALRSVVLQDTRIEELEGKITVDQTQEIGQDFARLMFQMLQSAEAANCLEWIVEHPAEGKFTLTLQRCRGKTPMELRNEAVARYESIEKPLLALMRLNKHPAVDWAAIKSHFAKYGVQRNANDQDHCSGSANGQTAANTIGQVEATPMRDEVSRLGGSGEAVCAAAGGFDSGH